MNLVSNSLVINIINVPKKEDSLEVFICLFSNILIIIIILAYELCQLMLDVWPSTGQLSCVCFAGLMRTQLLQVCLSQT
jgi:hypothetical protein